MSWWWRGGGACALQGPDGSVHVCVWGALVPAAVRRGGGGGWGLALGRLSRWLGCLASRSASRSAGCAIVEYFITGAVAAEAPRPGLSALCELWPALQNWTRNR